MQSFTNKDKNKNKIMFYLILGWLGFFFFFWKFFMFFKMQFALYQKRKRKKDAI